MTTIDLHNHFFPETWPDLDSRYGDKGWPWLKRTGPDTATVMMGDKPFREIDSRCWDAEKRLADMDRDGIVRQIISATPVLFAYQRKPEHALDIARLMNDKALEICVKGGARISALAQVPLQDVEASCREVERAMKSGHVGVQIGNHVGPKNLDDDGLVTFLHHCADLGCPVLVHPWDMMERERTANYMMAWTVGMPAETQLAIVSMILGGAFDRLPKTLRLCFAHGGGSFAFLLGRLENAWHRKDTVRGQSQHPPSHYLDRFYVDSAVFDDRTLDFLVKTMGEDQVVLGSDYPFPLGEQEVGTLVLTSKYLSDTAKEKILGANAMRFLGKRR